MRHISTTFLLTGTNVDQIFIDFVDKLLLDFFSVDNCPNLQLACRHLGCRQKSCRRLDCRQNVPADICPCRHLFLSAFVFVNIWSVDQSPIDIWIVIKMSLRQILESNKNNTAKEVQY